MRLLSTALLSGVALLATTGAPVHAQENPLEPLNRRVGTWVYRNYQKKAAWTPEERTITGEETVKWVLDKKFIQGDSLSADGDVKGHWLVSYDAGAKVYRQWYFGNKQGQFPRGDAVGRWDPKTERMDWDIDFGGDLRGEAFFQNTGKDKVEWGLIIRDGNGKLMVDSGGVLTRRK